MDGVISGPATVTHVGRVERRSAPLGANTSWKMEIIKKSVLKLNLIFFQFYLYDEISHLIHVLF